MVSGRMSFRQVAELKGVSTETVRNWAKNGKRVRGLQVALASFWIGGRHYTTEEFLERFDKECNPGMEAIVSPRRTSDSELARQRLISSGVYGSKNRGDMPRRRLQSKGNIVRRMSQALPVLSLPQAQGNGDGQRLNRRGRNARAVENRELAGPRNSRTGVTSQGSQEPK